MPNAHAPQSQYMLYDLARVLPEVEPLLTEVCAQFRITREALRNSDRRSRLHVEARWVLCGVLRDAGFSAPLIGAILQLDHTAVLRAVRLLDGRPGIAEQVAAFRPHLHRGGAS